MPLPIIVIVGRPNVGKSTLFNRISGSMPAIVHDVPGVTRDRNYREAQWDDQAFLLVDTGGFYSEAEEGMELQVREQAMFAIEEADLIMVLLDGKDGLTPQDLELVGYLRESGRDFFVVVTKIDAPSREDRLYDFHRLGASEIFGVSGATGYNLDILMERALGMLPVYEPEKSDYPRVAVVGRPNAGKSTLVNSLLGKKRMIVSPTPGTTRDSIDSVCTHYGKKYLFIDTAGIRRKAKGYDIERFALLRATRSIETADTCLVLLDASEGITADDQRIVGLVHKYGKGAVLLLNKWDKIYAPEATYKALLAEVKDRLWFFTHAPVLTISGIERKRITKVFSLIDGVNRERNRKITTKKLNNFIRAAKPPTYKGKDVRLSYLSQVGTAPPRFVLFTKYPEKLKPAYLRFLESQLRQEFSFAGSPIRLITRAG